MTIWKIAAGGYCKTSGGYGSGGQHVEWSDLEIVGDDCSRTSSACCDLVNIMKSVSNCRNFASSRTAVFDRSSPSKLFNKGISATTSISGKTNAKSSAHRSSSSRGLRSFVDNRGYSPRASVRRIRIFCCRHSSGSKGLYADRRQQ